MISVYESSTDASDAWIDGDYRYALWRCWDPSLPPMVIVMCNPSTADGKLNDATIRKCIGFARAFGFGGICVVNLSLALREASSLDVGA